MVLAPNKTTAFSSTLDIFSLNLKFLLLVASISNTLITLTILWYIVHHNAEIILFFCFKKKKPSETKMNQWFHIYRLGVHKVVLSQCQSKSLVKHLRSLFFPGHKNITQPSFSFELCTLSEWKLDLPQVNKSLWKGDIGLPKYMHYT